MGILTTVILILGMLAAFWSGFYVGFVKREGEKPPLPLIPDMAEFAEEIVDHVKDRIGKGKESEPVSFYD